MLFFSVHRNSNLARFFLSPSNHEIHIVADVVYCRALAPETVLRVVSGMASSLLLLLLCLPRITFAQQQQRPPHQLLQNALGLDSLAVTYLSRFLNEKEERFGSLRDADEKMKKAESPLPLSFRSPLQEKYRNKQTCATTCHGCSSSCSSETLQECAARNNNDKNDDDDDDDGSCKHHRGDDNDKETATCKTTTTTCCASGSCSSCCSSTETTHTLSAECVCGSCRFDFEVSGGSALEYCHCSGCRKYTVGPFGCGIRVSDDHMDRILQLSESMPLVKSKEYPCEVWNNTTKKAKLERWHCKNCLAPIASAQTKDGAVLSVSVAAGVVTDDSIPDRLALWWLSEEGQTHRYGKHPRKTAPWLDAKPGVVSPQDIPDEPLLIEGGCACGNVRYVALCLAMDFQHCYCRLCRQCSGTAYQTWVPLPVQERFMFTENKQNSLQLVRTTPHGQRHMCKKCGGTLTIVYDTDPGIVWVAAGSFDDDSLPKKRNEMEKRLYSVRHICCDWMQPWYQLPDDQLPRRRFPQ